MDSLAVLMDEIDAEMRLTAGFTGRTELSPAVREAMLKVPRDSFVPEADKGLAYANRPLPIGHGQTISQPFIVALMTELLDPKKTDIVLEVGTGSGYEAAILAEIVEHVYTVEIVEELANRARQSLAGYVNVDVRLGDGNQGWPEYAPYDSIIVAAAAEEVPPALVAQLKIGGRMVLPVGKPFGDQDLMLVLKDRFGGISERSVLPVAFVPLRGPRWRRR
ncbi:MAG: protein-L-isoaspartate(D-aspartate) O-methyltransferase [Alphaproteobacteria bacterium]